MYELFVEVNNVISDFSVNTEDEPKRKQYTDMNSENTRNKLIPEIELEYATDGHKQLDITVEDSRDEL